MDFYQQGWGTAGLQMQRNIKALEEVSTTFRGNSENAMKVATSAVEGYFKVAASATELSWRTITAGQEISRTVMNRGPIPELSSVEKGAPQSFFDSLSAQMAQLNATITDTANGMMETIFISSPKVDPETKLPETIGAEENSLNHERRAKRS